MGLFYFPQNSILHTYCSSPSNSYLWEEYEKSGSKNSEETAGNGK